MQGKFYGGNMVTGITIAGRDWVEDPSAPNGRKEVITYGVTTAALIDQILTEYPHTGEGSYAYCNPEGVLKQLIGGVWV